MKEILKNKSKPTLITTQGREESTSLGLQKSLYNIGMTENTMSSGPNNSSDYYQTFTAKSNKYNVVEYGYERTSPSNKILDKNESRVSRLS